MDVSPSSVHISVGAGAVVEVDTMSWLMPTLVTAWKTRLASSGVATLTSSETVPPFLDRGCRSASDCRALRVAPLV